MTTLNTTTAANSSTQLSVERQLAELVDEVRVSVGPQATLAAKISFNSKETLNKFNNLIEKAINNIQEELKQAVTSKSSQAIIDDLNKQLNLVTERATTFRNYLNGLSSSTSITRSANSEQGNALSAWLDEVSPLAEPEDLTEMPFQSLKADRTNVPRDFSVEGTTDINIKTRDLKNIDDFFLPEYIASANETEITDDILAKAKELANSPVKIYEWVRNNVEWQPTWGGQQTADMTLDVRRGNAMDISTLMIALLRAAKIPARYVHGTVDIPVDNFINMAGDFENVNAAMDFVSAGGIPVTSVTVGGKIAKVRIEHVWVEAAVPYYPSRGAKPVSARNPIDSWIPLDGSYKQYEYLQGIDEVTVSNLDGEKITNDLISSGSVNEQEGWVQGLNSNIIQQAQFQARDNLVTHIFNMQKPTLNDIVGGRKIIEQKFSMLPGSLPYLSVVRGVSNIQLPNALQVQVTLGLEYNHINGDYIQKKEAPLYQLNQQNIIISYKPASKADEEAIKALSPSGFTDFNQLPNFLPSSIHVIPEIKCNGEVLLTSSIIALGEDLEVGYQISTQTRNYLNLRDKVISGSYLALAITGSNLSKKIFDSIYSKLQYTKQILDQKDIDKIGSLTRDELLGDMFTFGVQGYYIEYISKCKVMSAKTRVNYQAIPSIGTYGYEPYKKTFFGLNRGIESHGIFMNIRVAQTLEEAKGSKLERKQFNQQIGLMSSALEHQIPEHFFNDTNGSSKIEGFSAVKALAIALQQGQRIYTINYENEVTALQNLKLDSLAMSEIKNALAVGKEVITHTEQIEVPGFKGSGYLIIDPDTGDGAYKISGGKNGGFFLGILMGAAFTSVLYFTIALWAAGIAAGPLGVGAVGLLTAMLTPIIAAAMGNVMNLYASADKEWQKCFVGGMLIGITIMGLGPGFGVIAGLKTKALIDLIFGVITAITNVVITFEEVESSATSCFR
ncbi:transglutaminase-like domain-containing protein [Entomomonas moraniae]|nr:transglutaminase-like domain-containing protein [Entomomonas moraniae]